MTKQNCEKTNLAYKSRYLPLLLVVFGVVAYANSFDCPFIFDDTLNIRDNPNIRSLWPLTRAMSAPPQSGIVGRPILSLSLALNYAFSGYSVWSYHAINLLIHILTALVLYGIVLKTFLSERLRHRFGNDAAILALAMSLIWLLHPVQTQSVTYIIQRSESLMGLFYLLTLYTAIRSMQSKRPVIWSFTSVFCCAAGMATKQVMVTAPLMVLLYDRTFIAGSFNSAIRCRKALYAGLAMTWGILAALLFASGSQLEPTVGFSVGIRPLEYALSQFGVIVHYLRLFLWPADLCLDYYWPVAKNWVDIVPPMLVVIGILAVIIWQLVRNRSWSYPGVWFFVILAPTSSFVPLADLAFEHRLYLPLAAPAVGLVIAVYLSLRYAAKQLEANKPTSISIVRGFEHWAGGVLIIVVAILLTWATVSRNRDYRSPLSIWQSVLEVAPANPRAHNNMGLALQAEGNLEDAVAHFEQALQIKSDSAEIHYNLGTLLQLQDKLDEAIDHYRQALQFKPDYAKAYNNLGTVLQLQGKLNEAITCFRKSLELAPGNADVHYNLGSALQKQGNLNEAISHYKTALQINPDDAGAQKKLGVIFTSQGKLDK